ncbi:MAG TPA: hypothetical protein EYG89_02815 [Bacteroidia bacterium]|nr:hypothetical protein [Bacteroidia bacterium]
MSFLVSIVFHSVSGEYHFSLSFKCSKKSLKLSNQFLAENVFVIFVVFGFLPFVRSFSLNFSLSVLVFKSQILYSIQFSDMFSIFIALFHAEVTK